MRSEHGVVAICVVLDKSEKTSTYNIVEETLQEAKGKKQEVL